MPIFSRTEIRIVFLFWYDTDGLLSELRSILFDMGCVEEERISSCGKMFVNIKIGQDELTQFFNLKGLFPL